MIAKRNSKPGAAAGVRRFDVGGTPEGRLRRPFTESIREAAAEHPVWILAAAFAAGVALGWLIKRT